MKEKQPTYVIKFNVKSHFTNIRYLLFIIVIFKYIDLIYSGAVVIWNWKLILPSEEAILFLQLTSQRVPFCLKM